MISKKISLSRWKCQGCPIPVLVFIIYMDVVVEHLRMLSVSMNGKTKQIILNKLRGSRSRRGGGAPVGNAFVCKILSHARYSQSNCSHTYQ